MPDFDIEQPSPDAGHEAIRVAVVDAIANLAYNTDDVGLSLSLADTLFTLLDGLLAQVGDLSARLAALEPAVFTSEESPSAN